jgi:hypothetical protein
MEICRLSASTPEFIRIKSNYRYGALHMQSPAPNISIKSTSKERCEAGRQKPA